MWTGVEIKADVSGAENVGRLADETEKAAQAAQKMKQVAEAKAVLGIKTDRLRAELAEVEQSYAELKASGTLTKRELKQATAAYTARVRELKAELKGVPSKLNPIAASVRGMGGAMLGVAGVGGGLYAVKEGLQQVVQATAEYAAIRSRMEYAFGGTEAAGVQMQWVKGLAEELGLEVRTLADGYAQLASATKNIGFTTGQAEAQGNSEAAARYRQAVSLQRQIYRERAEQEEQAEKVRAEKPQADLAAAFEAAPPQIGIPLSDLQRLIEARDKRVAEAAAERVIAGLEAAFRRTV